MSASLLRAPEYAEHIRQIGTCFHVVRILLQRLFEQGLRLRKLAELAQRRAEIVARLIRLRRQFQNKRQWLYRVVEFALLQSRKPEEIQGVGMIRRGAQGSDTAVLCAGGVMHVERGLGEHS